MEVGFKNEEREGVGCGCPSLDGWDWISRVHVEMGWISFILGLGPIKLGCVCHAFNQILIRPSCMPMMLITFFV